jgi:hypothetical protein
MDCNNGKSIGGVEGPRRGLGPWKWYKKNKFVTLTTLSDFAVHVIVN